jgi:D-threo-aldose 1-dehydrogenase
MTISDADHRSFGKTGLSAPLIVFRGDMLGNAARVIPDQTKRVICGEWFQRVTPPVFIEVSHNDNDEGHAVLELGRTLRRLDISSNDVVINLGITCAADLPRQMIRDAVLSSYHKACTLWGEAYTPRMVTLEISTELSSTGVSPADREKSLNATLDAIHAMTELKSAKEIAGVCIRCRDWRIAKELSDSAELDVIALVGGITILRHPPELVEFLTSLAERQIAAIAAGVFHGGFLVGGSRFEDRVVSPDDPANQSLFAWRKAFTSLCHGHGVRPAHACIQFALSAPGVAAVSLSTTHAERVADNVEAVINRIPAGLWASMKEEGFEADYAYLE